MWFCNNCGYQSENEVKYCNECGTKISATIDSFKDTKNTNKLIFRHNGVDIDLQELIYRHGKSKINAIQELRIKTKLNLFDAKTIIDEAYMGRLYTPSINEKISKGSNGSKGSKGCLNTVLWTFSLFILLLMFASTDSGIENEYLTDIAGFSLVAIILFAVWLVILRVLGKENIIPRNGLRISTIILSICFGISLFGYARTLFIATLFLVYKYRKKTKIENEEKRIMSINLKEEEYRNKIEIKNKIVEQIVELIFEDSYMKSRLNDFILQHTKRYDYGEINYAEYLKTIDMFLTYINRKIDTEFHIPVNEDTKEARNYWVLNPGFNVDRDMIKLYIESNKIEVYSDHMKSILKMDDSENFEETVYKYLDTFGEKGVMSLNLKILSKALDEDYEEICGIVEKKHNKIKEEYEMKKLENDLFNSKLEQKDMKYIDSLTGYQFEDFLKELFISFGYNSKELPYSNDYGADLIISKGFNEIVIQAKNYSGSVGNKAVQEVLSAKIYYKCDIAMVITNSYYTQNAIKTAQASGIILVNRDGLKRIVNEGSLYFNSLVS